MTLCGFRTRNSLLRRFTRRTIAPGNSGGAGENRMMMPYSFWRGALFRPGRKTAQMIAARGDPGCSLARGPREDAKIAAVQLA